MMSEISILMIIQIGVSACISILCLCIIPFCVITIRKLAKIEEILDKFKDNFAEHRVKIDLLTDRIHKLELLMVKHFPEVTKL